MKLSLAWIFDHINADFKKIDIETLVAKINKSTAEIESYFKIKIDLDNLFLAQVRSINQQNIILYVPELNKEVELSFRSGLKQGDILTLKKENLNFSWAKTLDLGSSKDSLLPTFSVNGELVSGHWKKHFENEDIILELDNKSITHRPDLWGHRGFAREIAALLNLDLIPLDEFIAKIEVKNTESPFNIQIKDTKACKRFATLYIPKIEVVPSVLNMAARLARIDSKPINLIVDATNYVMFDISQPMHAFDAEKINKKIIVRFANNSEKLTLIDNEEIELNNKDLIVADANQPLALAGIMGGKDSQVEFSTKSILLESANFEASTIRLSSSRLKKRTEASARFEKSLDPNQNIIAIKRFIKLIKDIGIDIQVAHNIISLGSEQAKNKIEVTHEFIENRVGTKISPEFIKNILLKLDFEVSTNEVQYNITVPTFRGTKDVKLPEDIVEEIVRFFGYENIPYIFPTRKMVAFNIDEVMLQRKIKQTMAYGCLMHEVQNYPFYDESFLNELNWYPKDSISVASPVSQNWQKLVTSLIPHLLKNIQQNLHLQAKLNFFELNKIWTKTENMVDEKKSLAGIFFEHKSDVDFDDAKSNLQNLFDMLALKVDWVKANNLNLPWYSPYQSAYLIHNEQHIGTAGKISKNFLSKISSGDAFIFELDLDYILRYKSETTKFKPLLKYPSVWIDISLLVPLESTVKNISDLISSSDKKIYKVELIDSFTKDDWKDKKSLTLRFHIADETKTLSKEEIDEITNKVNNNVLKIGAQLR